MGVLPSFCSARHREGRDRRGGASGAAPAASDDQLLGQLSSMFFSVVLRSCWPVIQEVTCFQKEPAPTSPGIWSDPSKSSPEPFFTTWSAALITGLTYSDESKSLCGD